MLHEDMSGKIHRPKVNKAMRPFSFIRICNGYAGGNVDAVQIAFSVQATMSAETWAKARSRAAI